MSSDVELLPLPEWAHNDEIVADMSTSEVRESMTTCARANMEPLQAEIEALRAEVERSERYAEQSERERLWAEARVERLAEALRDVRARTADLAAWLKSGNDVPSDLPFVFRERWQKIAADIRALEAAVGATQ